MTSLAALHGNAALQELIETLEALKKRREVRRLDYFQPYPKQEAFFAMGAEKRERMLMAGNQLGKTEAGAVEMSYHLTGLYPPVWNGRRWTRAIKCWAAGETSLLVRDVQQKKLVGEPGVEEAFGTGYIPKHMIHGKPTMARGVSDAIDTLQVKHVSGGISILRFKSYEQGRAKFQGDTIDIVWCDEEPPLDIYSECLTRVTATKGMIYVTFTPLKGVSDVVNRYLNERSPDRDFVNMTIEDALHIPPEERQRIIDGYPAHEREARVKGIPMLGSGRIFPVPEEMITCPMIDYIPPHWAKLWCIDFGIAHAFAAVLLLWDKDNDVIYVYHTIRIKDGLPILHAVPMKAVAANVPVAWPQDGHQRDKGSGEVLSTIYRKQGLKMLGQHASWPDGSVSTEAAIAEMHERMITGRLKVCKHLTEWLEEFRMYHRKDGVIVRERDDLISATQKGIMAKRYASSVPLGDKVKKRSSNNLAEGVDFDLF